MTHSRMHTLKLVTAAMIAIVAIVVIAQNISAVDTRLLFVTVTMPLALLLLFALAAGVVLGLFFSAVLIQRRKKTQTP